MHLEEVEVPLRLCGPRKHSHYTEKVREKESQTQPKSISCPGHSQPERTYWSRKLKKSNLSFGSWNVGTLNDNSYSDRTERGTAFIVYELYKQNIDIAALSKTRLSDGLVREAGSESTF